MSHQPTVENTYLPKQFKKNSNGPKWILHQQESIEVFLTIDQDASGRLILEVFLFTSYREETPNETQIS